MSNINDIRQYIGARYVIKIYQNSTDPSSAEWEQGTFEPFVLVTWQNSSYLSKKAVPGNIGNPADNPNYWVVTGAYNGQIAALQNQINTINNTDLPNIESAIQAVKDTVDDIAYTKLKGRRIVIITDSYGEVNGNFIEQMQAACPELITNDNFFAFAYGGAGFVSSNGAGWDWQSKFVTSGDIDTVTSPDTITDIMVLGGSNDRGADVSMSAIKTAAHTFYDSLVAKFPNAVIYVGYIGYSTNYLAQNYAPQVKQAYQECGFYGYRPIAHANSWLHYTGYITDNVHPNPNGSKLIANGVLNVLLGGGEDDISPNRNVPLVVTMESGYVSDNLGSRLSSSHLGHRSRVDLGDKASFSFTSGTFTFDGSWHKFATIGDSFLYGAADNQTVTQGMMGISYNSVNYSVPVFLKLFNHGLYYMLFPEGDLTGDIASVYVTVNMLPFEMDDIYM